MSHIKTLLNLAIAMMISMPAWSQSGGGSSSFGNWNGRAQARESKRWTLQEWLAQKERNALMDQWLGMNSASPYEFYLKGATHSFKSKEDTNAEKSFDSISGSFGAYAQAVGISGEYENNWEENYNDVSGMLNMRVLGNSLQTTSLTFHIGQRTRQIYENTQQENFRNLFGQASLQLYLTRYFGLQGSHRYYITEKHDTLGKMGGTLTEAGLFLDFKGLRLFGSWFHDIQIQDLNATETKTKREGIKTGLQIFF